MRYSKQPTPVIKANGSQHTIRQATIKLLEDTPAVLSLCKPCQENMFLRNNHGSLKRVVRLEFSVLTCDLPERDRLRPISTSANFDFGQFLDFRILGRHSVGPSNGGAPTGGGPNLEKVGPRRVGPRRVGPKGWSPEGWSPEGWGAQNFALFFPSSGTIFFLLSLSWGPFVEFWWCLKRRGPEMCTFGVLGLSCASPGGPVWWGRRGFTRQPESPNVHISGFRPSKTPTKFHERTPRERKKNANCGGRREKKERNFGRSGGGLSGGGLSGGGLSSGGRVQRKGPSEMGCRVRGFGFSSGFWGRKQKQNKNKMKREMSKNKKKVKKSKNKVKEKKRLQRRNEQTPPVRLRPTNSDFGQFQFRLRPISTSANSISASWPKSNCPKSNWPKSSILDLPRPASYASAPC